MRVFLTGGTGFVGLAVVARLVADGHEVVASAEAPPPAWVAAAFPDVQFAVLDVRDRASVAQAMRTAAPDLLIHGAALTPDEDRERAGGTAAIFEVNVAGTANALEAAAAAGVGRVLAFSSGAAYGRTIDEVAVLDETVECRPTALYAISKHAAERTALRLGALHGIGVVTPRLSAAWGPWEYRTAHRQTLSPGFLIVEAALRGRTPTIRDGTLLPLIDSRDAAEMLVRLAVSDATGVVNVGSDRMVDLADLARRAAEAAAVRGLPAKGPAHPIEILLAGRPPMALARLEAAIGAVPRSDPSDTLAATLDWAAAHPGAFPSFST